MRTVGRSFVLIPAVVVLLASSPVAVGQALACDGDDPLPPCGWPTEPRSSYDPETQTLNITWKAPAGVLPQDVDEYRVYRDGVQVDAVTAQYWTDDLSAWTTEYHSYQVSAVVDGIEGERTLPFYVLSLQFPTLNPSCPIARVVVNYNPPGVYPVIHQECLPP